MEYFSRSRSVSTLSHSHSLSLGKIHKREKRLRSLHNISTVRLRYNKQAEHSQPVLCCHFFSLSLSSNVLFKTSILPMRSDDMGLLIYLCVRHVCFYLVDDFEWFSDWLHFTQHRKYFNCTISNIQNAFIQNYNNRFRWKRVVCIYTEFWPNYICSRTVVQCNGSVT